MTTTKPRPRRQLVDEHVAALIVWRLSARRRAGELDGAGNRDRGARWNSGRGRGVVYTSLNVATCVLETFVHFGPKLRASLPDNLMLVEIEVPEDAGILRNERDEIPADADRPRRDGRTWYQRTGDRWLEDGDALVLIAPSAVVPQELNAMLNPAHPRMSDVRIISDAVSPRSTVGGHLGVRLQPAFAGCVRLERSVRKHYFEAAQARFA